MSDEVQHNDGGFPLAKPNYSARSLISPGSITLSISLRRAQQMRFSVVGPALSQRVSFFLLRRAGVVPLQAAPLSRRGTASDLSGLPGFFLLLPLGTHKGPCREGGLLRCAPPLKPPLTDLQSKLRPQ